MGEFLFALIPLVEVRKQLQNECNYTNHQTDDGNYDRNDLKTCHKAYPLSRTIPEGTLENEGNRPLSRLCSYILYYKSNIFSTFFQVLMRKNRCDHRSLLLCFPGLFLP